MIQPPAPPERPNQPLRSPWAAKLGALGLVALLLLAAWQGGVLERLGEPKALPQALVELGALGYLAFVAAYTLLQPFGVPGTIFIVAAPLIWPWPVAFALSMVGTMAASVVGFAFARFVARDWVAARIPPRLRRYDQALAQDALPTVAILRLVLWMPQALHWFFGVSQVGFWTHFWGSLLGYVPPLLLVSLLGGELFDASGQLQAAAWPAMAGLLGLSAAATLLARWHYRRRVVGR